MTEDVEQSRPDHRVAVIGAGTLDSLPHNGAVVTLPAVCVSRRGESYRDIVMTAIVGPVISLVAVSGRVRARFILIDVERFEWRAVESGSAFRRA
jgi:hypothetical protein